MFMKFVEAAALSVAIAKAGAGGSPDSLRELEKTIANGCGLGPHVADRVKELKRIYEASFEALEEETLKHHPEDERPRIRKFRRDMQQLNACTWHEATIDVSKAQPPDQLPTLLSCSVDDLQFMFRELPPDDLFNELTATALHNRTALIEFASRLMRHCPEARAKLQSEPEKMACSALRFDSVVYDDP